MKIYGFLRFRSGLGGGPSTFILFNNLLATTLSIDEKFDLKVTFTMEWGILCLLLIARIGLVEGQERDGERVSEEGAHLAR